MENHAKKCLVDILLYPVELANTLIQLGYTPRKVYEYRGQDSLLVYRWPSLTEYILALFGEEGVRGFTRGLLTHLAAQTVRRSTITEIEHYNETNCGDSTRCNNSMVNTLALSFIKHAAGIIASHPLHVIATRQAAQFIGRETNYSGFLMSPFLEVYSENGLLGFISGLVPRLISQVTLYVIMDLIEWTLKKYIVDVTPLDNSSEHQAQIHNVVVNNGKLIVTLAQQVAMSLTGMVTNPFLTVCRNIEVSGSGLAIGSPPYMPEYSNWIECWVDMYGKKQLGRTIGMFPNYRNYPFFSDFLF